MLYLLATFLIAQMTSIMINTEMTSVTIQRTPFKASTPFHIVFTASVMPGIGRLFTATFSRMMSNTKNKNRPKAFFRPTPRNTRTTPFHSRSTPLTALRQPRSKYQKLYPSGSSKNSGAPVASASFFRS